MITTSLPTVNPALDHLNSTLTSLLEASYSWSVNIDNGIVNGVIFIDSKKDLDTIDHNILLRKLQWATKVLAIKSRF